MAGNVIAEAAGKSTLTTTILASSTCHSTILEQILIYPKPVFNQVFLRPRVFQS